MNLTIVTDAELVRLTEGLVREEQALLTKVLHHLREINRRRLFSSLGYKSLYDFGIRHLRYSEDQIYRRIAAMRMLRDVPELEAKINSGELTLTHIGLAQSHFRQEEKIQNRAMSADQKLKVLTAISNKPVREAERITYAMSSQPQTLKPDRVQSVSPTHSEIKFTAHADLLKKIETLKGRLAHKYPTLSMAELLNELCDLGLKHLDPTKTAAPRKLSVNSAAQARRDVLRRANKQCENCGSGHALEVDHIYPKAWGGTNAPQNLRLLCRNCNQRAAIKTLGQSKMDLYLKP